MIILNFLKSFFANFSFYSELKNFVHFFFKKMIYPPYKIEKLIAQKLNSDFAKQDHEHMFNIFVCPSHYKIDFVYENNFFEGYINKNRLNPDFDFFEHCRLSFSGDNVEVIYQDSMISLYSANISMQDDMIQLLNNFILKQYIDINNQNLEEIKGEAVDINNQKLEEIKYRTVFIKNSSYPGLDYLKHIQNLSYQAYKSEEDLLESDGSDNSD